MNVLSDIFGALCIGYIIWFWIYVISSACKGDVSVTLTPRRYDKCEVVDIRHPRGKKPEGRKYP